MYSFSCKNPVICKKCLDKYAPEFIEFRLDDIKCLAIYKYSEEFESLIYKFKGCFDIELAEAFLAPWVKELKLKYKGFYLLPIPSNEKDDKRREFNHVIEIFKCLNLPFINCLYKSQEYKQSSMHKNERNNISKVLKMSNLNEIKNKKILIVDDICTTGSTLLAAIKLVKQHSPKQIKVLVIAKVDYKG